jgi:Tol biopolymer transport system component/DNA-binding winged helix-turn-helix (wHTH) protein
VIDIGQRTVTRDGKPLGLGKLTFDVLAAIADAAPNLVTQEELAEQVWHGRYVAPDTIKQRIKILRRDLGDNASDPRYLLVVRGQGYRLLPEVDVLDDSDSADHPGLEPAVLSRRGFVYAASALGTVTAVAGSAAWWLSPAAARKYVIGQQRPLTTGTDMALDPAISPDGQWLAYSRGRLGAMEVYVRNLDGTEEWELTAGLPGEHRWPRWSPDSRSIAFRTALSAEDHYLRTIRLDNREYRDIASERHLNGHDWSQVTGEIVYAEPENERVWICSSDGREKRPVAKIFNPHAPAWSPDGNEILVASGNYFRIFGLVQFMNVAPSSIWLVSAETGEKRQVTTGERGNDCPRWESSGKGFFFVSNRNGRRAIHHAELPAAGATISQTTRVGGQDALSIDISRDEAGISFAECVIETNIWRMPIPKTQAASANPQEMTAITKGPQQVEGFAVSSDGKWLVYNSDQSGNQDIYLAALDGSVAERPLTFDAATDSMPSLSPDHEEVAFHSARDDGIRNLYICSLTDGSLTQVAASQNQDYCPQWGPDGNSLYFFSYDSADWGVWRLTRPHRGASWSNLERISDGEGIFARVSPRSDGPVVYFGEAAGVGRGLIGKWRDNRTELLFAIEGEYWAYAAFSPNGETVYLKRHDADLLTTDANIWAIDVATGKISDPIRMEQGAAGNFEQIYFDVDESYFYISLTQRQGVVTWADLNGPR